ncbi:hypothetical protein BAE44_0020908 [Dichanthelium oligosanthes]|uniref:Uncharacterized protein n=1 Tax=Dichanthelium oligosanthes TaxID=888268 RepID=A0A1E5UYT8_9POAL|nr:hypothetical protein BAE44_0020908 [Dichanthelium oligosanthes]
MASGCVPDFWQWIRSLPEQWRGGSYSLQICNSPSTNQSLNLVISRHSETQPLSLSFFICAEFHDPILLWSSNHSTLRSAHTTDLSAVFLHDIICGVLRYGPYSNSKSLFRLPNVQIPLPEDSGKSFNLAAFTLGILVSIYEAPSNLRHEFIYKISVQLMRDEMRSAAKKLMLSLGSNIEELWMRSVNLGVTNWTMEGLRSGGGSPSPFKVFSYALSASRLWKVQVYCPVVAMVMEHPSHQAKDEKLLFSLNYQQLEGVIQLVYRVTIKENWIDVAVKVDNIRFDLVQLVSETLMAKQGYGSDEKHFPSRVSLQLTPMAQADILSLSVSRSTDNPVHEVGLDAGLDASLGMPASIGIGVSSHETVTRALRPWKFEHSVLGNKASLSWFLHDVDGGGGREVFSSEPRGGLRLFRPRSWFRDRYTNPGRPFTRSGGVIFAGDEYGEGVCWRMCPSAAGKAVEWEVMARVWVTYWPNKKRTLHTETRMLEFRELLQFTVAE